MSTKFSLIVLGVALLLLVPGFFSAAPADLSLNPLQVQLGQLLLRHHVDLEKPSQKALLRLLLLPKEQIGQTTYILKMRHYKRSRLFPGAVILYTEFPPFSGPPGTYLLVMRTPNLTPRSTYTCVVTVDEVYTAPMSQFRSFIREKFARGVYRDPMLWLAVPFEGEEYPIPVTTEVECLK